MKTDRELLELAAKAAGIESWRLPKIWPEWHADEDDEWDPLTDDSDALRLVVKLEMVINAMDGRVIAGDMSDVVIDYDAIDGQHDGLRRAIVRAAAAIGESMP